MNTPAKEDEEDAKAPTKEAGNKGDLRETKKAGAKKPDEAGPTITSNALIKGAEDEKDKPEEKPKKPAIGASTITSKGHPKEAETNMLTRYNMARRGTRRMRSRNPWSMILSVKQWRLTRWKMRQKRTL